MKRSADDRQNNWLALPTFGADFTAAAIERFGSREERLKDSHLADRMKRSWCEYYLRDEKGGCSAGIDKSKLNLEGERGEIIDLSPAIYRQKIQSRISLAVQTPPATEAVALNTDSKSQRQCRLALGVIDYYRTVHHVEDLRLERFEMSSVLAESYLHVRWDKQKGKAVGVDDSKKGKDGKGSLVYEGDFAFSLRAPHDVWFDSSSTDLRRPRAWVVREPVNRFDLLAQFGEDSKEIKLAVERAEPYSASMKSWDFDSSDDQFDDSIAVFFVYAERSPSLPNGRFAMLIDADGVPPLLDGPMPQSRAGVFPLMSSKVLFRNEGHTNNFGGLAIAQAYGGALSTILSNQASFALLRMLMARESGVIPHHLMLGLGAVEYNARDKQGQPLPPPQVLGGLQSPPELFTTVDILAALADLVMGDSAARRGDPDALKGDSGSKVAAMYSAAEQLAAADIRALVRSDEEVFNFMLEVLRDHATAERLVIIAGKSQRHAVEQFKGDMIKDVLRVIIRNPDPARDTFQGKMGQAELYKGVTDPKELERLDAVLNTGRIEVATEDEEQRRLCLEDENDALADDERDPAIGPPLVDKYDRHLEHIASHAAQRNDPRVRNNPAAMKRIEIHNQGHMDALTPDSPTFAGFEVLAVTGQKPLPPRTAPPPIAKGAPPGAPPPPKTGGGDEPAGPMQHAGQAPKPPSMPKNPNTGAEQPGSPPPPPVGV